MGLDTTHDCWHGSYGAFHVWRSAIAKAAGLPNLERMEGYWEVDRPASGLQLEYRVVAQALDRAGMPDLAKNVREFQQEPPIRWDALKPSPLHVLLHHSDCDGWIPAECCIPLADALEALLPLLPDGPGRYPEDFFRDSTRQFVAGLREAGAAGENVEFH